MKEQQGQKTGKTVKNANLGQKEARAEKRSEEELRHMGDSSGQKERKSPEGMSKPGQPKSKTSEK